MIRVKIKNLVTKEALLYSRVEVKERVIHRICLCLADRIKNALGVTEIYEEGRQLHHFYINGVLLDEWEGDALREFMERMDEEYRTTSLAMPVSPQDRLYNMLGGPHWRDAVVDADS